MTTHFTARVRLTRQAPRKLLPSSFAAPNGQSFKAADIYRIYFHGPAYQVLGRAWRDGDRVVGELAEILPSITIHRTSRASGSAAIELCFQTAGLWEITEEGRMGLPQHVDRVCLWRAPELAERAAVCRGHSRIGAGKLRCGSGGCGREPLPAGAGYKTVALPDRVDSELLKALHATA